MRARHHVGDELRFGRVGHRWFDDADDCGASRFQPDRLSKHARIAIERCAPEARGQHGRARRCGTVVAGIQQAADHGFQSHDIEVVATDHSGADRAGFAKPDHREPDRREFGDVGERAHTVADVLNLRNRERRVFAADAGCALPDVEQPLLVAVDQRPEEHRSHEAEDGGVDADAEGERRDHRQREPLDPPQRSNGVFQLLGECHLLTPRWLTRLATASCVGQCSSSQTTATKARRPPRAMGFGADRYFFEGADGVFGLPGFSNRARNFFSDSTVARSPGYQYSR